MVKIPSKHSWIRIVIPHSTQIQSFVAIVTHPTHAKKNLIQNSPKTFWVILLSDKQKKAKENITSLAEVKKKSHTKFQKSRADCYIYHVLCE